jgi:hypothetical protein
MYTALVEEESYSVRPDHIAHYLLYQHHLLLAPLKLEESKG